MLDILKISDRFVELKNNMYNYYAIYTHINYYAIYTHRNYYAIYTHINKALEIGPEKKYCYTIFTINYLHFRNGKMGFERVAQCSAWKLIIFLKQ